jgi:hypothetical protein
MRVKVSPLHKLTCSLNKEENRIFLSWKIGNFAFLVEIEHFKGVSFNIFDKGVIRTFKLSSKLGIEVSQDLYFFFFALV